MATTAKTTRTKRLTTRQQIVRDFKHWLQIDDEAKAVGARAAEVKDGLKAAVQAVGDEDDKGHYWLDLDEPVLFETWEGKVKRFARLKSERHLTPAVPQPAPDKAQELLEDKGLWLTKAQQNVIRKIQLACPYAVISVDVDVDAVAGAYFKDLISNDEYEAILQPQKETFHFRPGE